MSTETIPQSSVRLEDPFNRPTEPFTARPRLSRKLGLAIAAGSLVAAAALLTIVWSQTSPIAIGATAAAFFLITYTGASFAIEGRRFAVDRLATTLISATFVLAVLPLASLLLAVLTKGLSRISPAFINNNSAGISNPEIEGGVGLAIWGTLEITAMTALIAVPLGVMAAVYLVEYGRGPFAKVVTFLVDIMTGIPSIVAGLFAVSIITTILGNAGYRSGFVGAIALVVLMTPIVIRNTEEMLRLVPHELREASFALGVPMWRTIIKVVLRTSAAGIISGIVIATARVIGESAPLLITAMTTDYYNYNLFGDYMMTLPVYVYIAYKQGRYADAWGAALILILIVLLLNFIARLIARKVTPSGEH